MELIQNALDRGAKNLSEYESKRVLSAYGIPVTREKTVRTKDEAIAAATDMGYPVVLKGSGEAMSHKTELDLIALDLKDEQSLKEAFGEFKNRQDITVEEFLVQQMVKGNRELLAGLKRDPQFGPCVMFGLGGIMAEVLEDIAIRVAPLSEFDAMDMMDDIRAKKILNAFRGKPPVDRAALAQLLMALGKLGLENEAVTEIDINPVKLVDGKPVAVDALIVLKNEG
ncbi:MAG: acetate--CoA ligase family protein [Deltaproteobacteria bacterium]|nr:acetate--CoA ligase family protein [Deltaproteobacteria bacterium]MBW2176592.1 acetate--CoA ligase family protein [Deltaproteobacteria bacterium]